MSTQGLRDFQMDLREFEEKIMPQAHERFVKEIAFFALRGIVLKTPVDTGLLRGNWLVSAGSPNTAESSETDRTGERTISNGTSTINSSNPRRQIIFIQNNLPYAEPIENGHSQQKAPAGMVEVTLLEIKERAAAGVL